RVEGCFYKKFVSLDKLIQVVWKLKNSISSNVYSGSDKCGVALEIQGLFKCNVRKLLFFLLISNGN
ncbi:hypothetical protein QEG31_005436, partial [Pluralibacter gergoviae]